MKKDDIRQKMLDKLTKLFALGNSPNQHEAELALSKAAEIMREYQISQNELADHEVGEVEIETIIVEGSNGPRHYIWSLANSAAAMFDCRACMGSGLGKCKIMFFGFNTENKASQMMFLHLWKSWQSIYASDWRSFKEKAAEEGVKLPKGSESRSATMGFKQGHGMGFSKAIHQRVAAILEERKRALGQGTGNDLVVVKTGKVDALFASLTTDGGGQVSQGEAAGRMLGALAGESIPFHGVNHEGTRLLGNG